MVSCGMGLSSSDYVGNKTADGHDTADGRDKDEREHCWH